MRRPDREHLDEYHPLPGLVRESRPANSVARHRRKDRRWLAVLIIGLILMCLSGSVIAAIAMA